MSRSGNVRVEAARALAPVLAGRQSLAATLAPAQARVPPHETALLQALCYGVLRYGPTLEAVLAGLMQRPLKAAEVQTRAVLLCGLYQLGFMRVPSHAAVAESVEAVRLLGRPRLTGLVNGVLRSFERDSERLLARAASSPPGRYAHPQWLINMLERDWPQDWTAVLEANNQPPPMTLRVNRRRCARAQWLARAQLAADAVAGLEEAVQLHTPQEVEALPGFMEGEVSVQDAGAQWAATLIELAPGMRVLDACSAPGGKTGHLLERAPDGVEVTALDVDAGRQQRVSENLQRLGLSAQVLTGDLAAPDAWWDGQPFQRILLDAPCSATGVIRRHPDIKYLRRADDIPALAERQEALLQSAWNMLAPGGELLYVTCSVLHAENREVVERFLAARPDATVCPLPEAVGRERGPGRQRLPGEQGMDGFFYALLRRGNE